MMNRSAGLRRRPTGGPWAEVVGISDIVRMETVGSGLLVLVPALRRKRSLGG